jgi:hypothetical protein
MAEDDVSITKYCELADLKRWLRLVRELGERQLMGVVRATSEDGGNPFSNRCFQYAPHAFRRGQLAES